VHTELNVAFPTLHFLGNNEHFYIVNSYI